MLVEKLVLYLLSPRPWLEMKDGKEGRLPLPNTVDGPTRVSQLRIIALQWLMSSRRTFRGILQRGFLPRASCRYCRVPRELQDGMA
jgi:hypothetical protein